MVKSRRMAVKGTKKVALVAVTAAIVAGVAAFALPARDEEGEAT